MIESGNHLQSELEKISLIYKILITGSIHEIGLEMLSKEKYIDIQYAPDLFIAEIFKLKSPFYCILSRSEKSISKKLIEKQQSWK